jgi:hypothetical protein
MIKNSYIQKITKCISLIFVILSILLTIPIVAYGFEIPYTYVNAVGEKIVLIDNESATNPTYDELVEFIHEDETDKILYVYDEYMCADFAKELHDNAEEKGIRAGFVFIGFENKIIGHAINCFNTSDRGLVFVDCCGTTEIVINDNYDKIAYVELGKEYGMVSMQYTNDTSYEYYDLRKDFKSDRKGFFETFGNVKNIRIFWEM